MEDFLINALKEYGYIILFIWCIFEGEIALIMGGILSHLGNMDIFLAIVVAAFGGFLGDQFYFFIGKHFRDKITKKFEKQKRKFEIANMLLEKYGVIIIFLERYLYGFRTILPMAIAISGYNEKKFAIINFISSLTWAASIMGVAYFFGEQLLGFLNYAKHHWYFILPLILLIFFILFLLFKKIEKSLYSKTLKTT
ncbi:MAG: DedA family protein [Campylobacteraceae bacterium]